MSLSNSYICEAELATHECNPCPSDGEREYGRVRSTAVIFKDYLATLKADPTDPAIWLEGIALGKIIIIPETRGSFDPGDPKELPGYGERRVSYGPRTQTLTFTDPNYAVNYNFWNNIEDQTQLVVAYKTSSQVHIPDVAASVFAKDPVADDLEAEVTWEVKASWVSRNLPQLHDASNLTDIFTCVTV